MELWIKKLPSFSSLLAEVKMRGLGVVIYFADPPGRRACRRIFFSHHPGPMLHRTTSPRAGGDKKTPLLFKEGVGGGYVIIIFFHHPPSANPTGRQAGECRFTFLKPNHNNHQLINQNYISLYYFLPGQRRPQRQLDSLPAK